MEGAEGRARAVGAGVQQPEIEQGQRAFEPPDLRDRAEDRGRCGLLRPFYKRHAEPKAARRTGSRRSASRPTGREG